MEDSFYIGAYWGSRAEPLSQVRDKILQTLNKLSETDEQFLNWYESGMSRKEALKKKVVLNNETIERICLEMVKKGELDKKGVAKMGFIFGLWTGHHDDESSSISFNVGADSKWLTNSCVIKMPIEGVAKWRLLQSEKAKAIISILVKIWKPDYAVLTSHELGDKLNDANETGWITYRKSIKRVPKINGKIIYEKLDEGHLLTAHSSDYNLDDIINELFELKSII